MCHLGFLTLFGLPIDGAMKEAAASGAKDKREKPVEWLEVLETFGLVIIEQVPVCVLRKVDLTCTRLHCLLKNDPLRKSNICTLFKLQNSTLRAEKLTPVFHKTQRDLFVKSRTKLLAWLVEVANEFDVLTLTLQTAFIIVDRYFEQHWKNITNDELELLGATSFWIAAGFNERHPPCIDEMRSVCKNVYTTKDFTTMNIRVTQNQNFGFVSATPFQFAVEVCSMLNLPLEIMRTASYLMDLFMVQVGSIGVASSAIAGGSVMLSCYCTGMEKTGGLKSIPRLTQTPEAKIRHIVCKMVWLYYIDYFTHNEFGKADKTVVRPLTHFEHEAVNLRHSRLLVGPAAAPAAEPAAQKPPPRIKVLSTGSCFCCGNDACAQSFKKAFPQHVDICKFR